MTFTREEYEQHVKETQVREIQSRQGDLRFLTQAEVAAERLTGDPHWDTFLQILQAERDGCVAQEAVMQKKACDPLTTDLEELQRCRIQAIILRTTVDTLDRVLDLPKAMKKRGGRARELLEKVLGKR